MELRISGEFIMLEMIFLEISTLNYFINLYHSHSYPEVNNVNQRIQTINKNNDFYELYLDHKEGYRLVLFLEENLNKFGELDHMMILHDLKKELKVKLRRCGFWI